jgi:DNA-binding transcriptional ArsR family regulator
VDAELAVARIAEAIGEAPRVRMLYCLVDGRARTATELGVIAGVSASTASAHLHRLMQERLIKVHVQGKHRYYRLFNSDVSAALEKLSVIAGSSGKIVPNTPSELREARTCYDHIAGKLGVAIHNCFTKMRWLKENSTGYELSTKGTTFLEGLGINVDAMNQERRKFAYPCIDWSERQPHIGGALGAAILKIALDRKWVVRELDSRALNVTRLGKREMHSRLRLEI